MRINSAFLAESVELDSVISVARGWPEWWNLPSVPAEEELLLVLVVEFDRQEVGQPFDFDFTFRQGSQERQAGPLSLTRAESTEYVAGAPLYDFGFVRFDVEFHEVGLCEIDVSHNGTVLTTVRFATRLNPEVPQSE
jgi:hypothetical protein